ncbi:hypothetical protein ES703_40926 [subsurface metagenome]
MPIDGLYAEVTEPFIDIIGLELNSTYVCEVSAVNEVGEGLKSDPLSITTLAEPPLQFSLIIAATLGGTTDPAPGIYTFDADTTVVVTAIPHAGYQFVEWQEGGVPISTDNPINLLMDADRSITAVFEEVVPTHTLTILTVWQGITNPASGSWEYDTGASISVTAIPDAGWAFDHWEGDVTGTENPVSFIITADMTIIAVFSEIVVPPEEFALTISALEGGSTDPAPGPYTYIEGTLVTVTAIPSSGWKFDHWEGDLTGTNPEITVEMLQNLSIVAVFSEKKRVWPWVAGGLGLLGLGVVLVKKMGKIKGR